MKVNRKYYKLTRVDETVKVAGPRGQALDQKVEKYERTELPNLATLKSGDLVEIELEIDSKNDYEYLIFEDPKAAGFEPMAGAQRLQRAMTLGAYMELRDDKVCFFVRRLARGKHSSATGCGRRSRARSAPADAGVGDVRAGTEGELRRDQAGDCGLTDCRSEPSGAGRGVQAAARPLRFRLSVGVLTYAVLRP